MLVTRGGFTQIVGNAFAGIGFPAEGPTVYEFPIEMFDSGSDLTPINENIDKIVYGLTKWEPKVKEKGVFTPPKATVQGKDYEEAVANMNLLLLKNMWGDGLPILPATEERVNWILTGTDLSPDTEIGRILPRGGIGTVNALAVALAMAGGRPEHLPVLIAVVEAVTQPGYGLEGCNATTNSNIPAVVVNGPIAKQIRLNSGYGCLGPDPQRSAGGPIGRAIRVVMQNMGGAIPGIGTMAIYGGMRYTNAVFAEDEDGLPPGWPSLSVERGFSKDANVITATVVSSMTNILWFFGTKEQNDSVLTLLAKVMGAPNLNRYGATWEDPDVGTGLALIPRGVAASLAEVSGYSKADVKTFLWNNSKAPWDDFVATGMEAWAKTFPTKFPEGQAVPLTPKPEMIRLVVAGGAQSGHGYWMECGNIRLTISAEIKVPANWDELLKQAEEDLGPLPAA